MLVLVYQAGMVRGNDNVYTSFGGVLVGIKAEMILNWEWLKGLILAVFDRGVTHINRLLVNQEACQRDAEDVFWSLAKANQRRYQYIPILLLTGEF